MQLTLDQFIRHAQLFGTMCVYETAEQEGFSSADLARLRAELDELEAGRKSRYGFRTIGRRPRRSQAEKMEAAVILRSEGLTTTEIGTKLGVSADHAQRLLRNLEKMAA